MPLNIIRGDITKLNVDAIVNAANETLLGGGGVDGAIHRAAGPELLKECRTLNGCKTGQAKITKGYNLPAKYVIHTVGPIYKGGNSGEEGLLRSAYRESLKLAGEKKLGSVALPLISAGVYGYPKDEAVNIALEEMNAFLKDHDMDLFLVIFDEEIRIIQPDLKDEVEVFVQENFLGDLKYQQRRIRTSLELQDVLMEERWNLPEQLDQLDETFSQSLLRLIDEKGLDDVTCYKKANIDRRLFSKIRSNPDYKPSKETAVAFCIALELNEEEADNLLMKAGYALSNSSKFDVIIKYFIVHEIYDVYEVNKVLFEFDQKLLGSW